MIPAALCEHSGKLKASDIINRLQELGDPEGASVLQRFFKNGFARRRSDAEEDEKQNENPYC